MKKKWILIAALAAVALALIVILGGWAIQNNAGGADVPASSTVPTEDASAAPSGTGLDGLPPIDTTLPSSDSKTSVQADGGKNGSTSPTPTPAETIVTDENGNQTITPNWSTGKLPDDANVVSKSPDANMGGSGGGKLDTDSDGAYHGDHPDQQPTATPQSSAAPTKTPSPQPSGTPDATQPTPAPTTTPPQSPAPSTPAPTQPDNSPSDDGGPPSYNGKNGEISPDGKYGWVDGFGWIERGGSDGGESGNDYDPDWELSGEKVGDM